MEDFKDLVKILVGYTFSVMIIFCLGVLMIGCKQVEGSKTTSDTIESSPVPVDFGLCEDGLQGEDDDRDDVLIIGDSISMGYLPFVQAGLSDMDVMRNPCNGRSSRNGVLNIDSWLAKRSNWKVIVFNHGLWDSLKGVGISLQDYENNLRTIAAKLKDTGAIVIFNTTTYIPIGETGRHFNYELDLNRVAKNVMSDFNIKVNDLYQLSTTIPELRRNYPLDNDVHYIDQGSEVLGNSVIQSIQEEL